MSLIKSVALKHAYIKGNLKTESFCRHNLKIIEKVTFLDPLKLNQTNKLHQVDSKTNISNQFLHTGKAAQCTSVFWQYVGNFT